MHDDQQVARLFLFDQALKAGQFPVRWVDGLGFGFGYPLFVFYPPIVYIVAEIFHLVGFGFISSVKLTFFFSIFLSGIAMYVLTKEFFGRFAALISALFYMYVPYRALDIYVRGAIAESFSFVWLPLILWSFFKLFETNDRKYALFSGIFLALLMITHNLIFLPFMLILPLYLTFLFWQSGNKKKFTVYCILSIIYSLFLSAFFWIPALMEKKFTLVDQLLLVNLADYRIHFVHPKQLWNWPWGFGGSAAGLVDGISFKIGKLHILVSVAAIFLAILLLLKNKKLSRLSIVSPERSRRVTYHLSLITFGLFIFSAFMTTFYSKFIWEMVKPLAYLQFPWRFLTFTALFSSFLAGAFIYFLRLTVLKLTIGIILIFLLIVPNLKLFKPQYYRTNLTNQSATTKEVINWDVSNTSFEYIPKGAQLTVGQSGTSIIDIDKSQIPEQKIEVLSGTAQIDHLESSPSKISMNISAAGLVQIKANVFDFPGWSVLVDNQPTRINSNNNLKLVTFNVPTGDHKVVVEFKNTATRFWANLISLFSILLLSILIVYKWRIQRAN